MADSHIVRGKKVGDQTITDLNAMTIPRVADIDRILRTSITYVGGTIGADASAAAAYLMATQKAGIG
jgi:hypothetical protein